MTGKAALVTGGASGLGRATALALARAGADICIVDRNAAGLDETEAMLRAQGVQVLVHETDLSIAEKCSYAVAAAHEKFGRLDALCNVAGVIRMSNSAEMAIADWNFILAVNLSAPFHMIQSAIPHLLEVGGAVVNVASTASFFGQAYLAAYCASKAGIANLTKALAMEFMHKPIRFNAVAPGGMATGIMGSFGIPEDIDQTLLGRYMPIRGLIEVDQVAEMIAYLASPAASNYHGACITVDNGTTAG